MKSSIEVKKLLGLIKIPKVGEYFFLPGLKIFGGGMVRVKNIRFDDEDPYNHIFITFHEAPHFELSLDFPMPKSSGMLDNNQMGLPLKHFLFNDEIQKDLEQSYNYFGDGQFQVGKVCHMFHLESNIWDKYKTKDSYIFRNNRNK